MPKVSIITPCFNSEGFIGKTIKSVCAQTFADWEYIIVDDGSRDCSVPIIENYLLSDSRLRLIRQSNQGVCSARNKGFSACSAHSDYLLFLDADDCLEPEMLTTMVTYLDRERRVGLGYCGHILIGPDDELLPEASITRWAPNGLGVRQIPILQPETSLISILCGAPVLPSCSLIRRSTYEKLRGWDEDFGQHHEEVNLFMQFTLISQIHFIPQRLLRYRRHPAQSSAGHLCKDQVQSRKLEQVWKNALGLSEEQKRAINFAWNFREGRLAPYLRLLAGHNCILEGDLWQAMRHYLWAGKRYLEVNLRSK